MTLIIAIVGGSASGKTTLARALARLLGGRCAVIAEDDYYRDTGPGADPAAINFDAPDAKEASLLAAHLKAARAGASFEKPRYDLRTHRRGAETETIAPVDALIVEGLHLLAHPALEGAFDFAVYIEAEESLRLGRRLIRDVEERARAPRAVLDQFFAHVRPMHKLHVDPQRARADLIVDARFEDDSSVAAAHADAILAALRRKRGHGSDTP